MTERRPCSSWSLGWSCQLNFRGRNNEGERKVEVVETEDIPVPGDENEVPTNASEEWTRKKLMKKERKLKL